MKENLEKLANYRTRLEAETAAGILEDNGVPYLIQTAEGSGFVPMPGGATILVRADHLERALELLKDED